ncbi:hypothetical protein P9112_003395 [Eukaryota sp. TZLM1-RC]
MDHLLRREIRKRRLLRRTKNREDVVYVAEKATTEETVYRKFLKQAAAKTPMALLVVFVTHTTTVGSISRAKELVAVLAELRMVVDD